MSTKSLSVLGVIKNLRPINLVMVYVTQILFYFLFINPYYSYNTSYNLSAPKIQLFALVTVLITLSGYLINDYFDIETDRINGKVKLEPKSLLLIFFFTLLVGFCLALGLAFSLGQPSLSLVYLVAVTLLYLYSASWKKKVLIGNFVVSAFTAGVPLILLYAEWENLNILIEDGRDNSISSVLFFGVFTFLISMVREIIKDIEDVKGDLVAGYKTLPIIQGIERAKMLTSLYGFTLLLVLVLWQFYSFDLTGNIGMHLSILVLLYVPIIFMLIKLMSKSPNWSFLSQLCKLIMLMGLIILILTRCFYT